MKLLEELRSIGQDPKKRWFSAKLYGWGWTPQRWQGWLALGIYLLLIFLFIEQLDPTTASNSYLIYSYFLPIIVLTGLLIALCYLTGEKPRWRWGK